MSQTDILRGPIPIGDIHRCPACRIFVSGPSVTRLGRNWHADCWVHELEARARAVLDRLGDIPWRRETGDAMERLREATNY